MSEGYGMWDSKKFEKGVVEELKQKISSSKKFTYIGYSLFILGFALQLIAAICDK